MCKSSLASFDLNSPLPLPCIISPRLTCPNRHNQFSIILFLVFATPTFLKIFSFRILSVKVFPHIHDLSQTYATLLPRLPNVTFQNTEHSDAFSDAGPIAILQSNPFSLRGSYIHTIYGAPSHLRHLERILESRVGLCFAMTQLKPLRWNTCFH